jgi:hypothetical protein
VLSEGKVNLRAQPIAAACLHVSPFLRGIVLISCAASYSFGEATLGQMSDLKGVGLNALGRIDRA